MTDRPILFSAQMVRALIDGRKSQTRRLAWRKARKGQDPAEGDSLEIHDREACPGKATLWKPTIWQKVRPGDRLWVRESFKHRTDGPLDKFPWPVIYRAEYTFERLANSVGPWRPSIHMSRWASRLTLVVTETKIERVSEISVDDAWAEGAERRSKKVRQMWLYGASEGQRSDIYRRAAKWEFQDLWNSLHKPGNRWEDNPEVVALTFTVHKTNIDATP